MNVNRLITQLKSFSTSRLQIYDKNEWKHDNLFEMNCFILATEDTKFLISDYNIIQKRKKLLMAKMKYDSNPPLAWL